MTPREALLHAIRDNLDDDLARLAFADWLEEQGDPESVDHAEFIRVECTLAGMDPEHPDRRALFRRDLALLAQYKDSWFGPVRRYCSFWEVRRGFLDEVSTDAANFLAHADWIWNNHPLRFVRLPLTSADVEPLATSPYLAGLRRLDLSGVAGDDVASALAQSPHLTRLERLHPPTTLLGPAGARALAGSPHLARLAHLNLSGAQIRASGLRALLESPHLPSLAALDLSGRPGNPTATANVGPGGIHELASCPGSARLRKVLLFSNNADDDALLALARSPYLDGLELLGLALPERASAEARTALQERFGRRWQQHAWLG